MSCSYVPNSREKTFGKETHHRHAHSHSHHWHAHGWHTGHTCGQSLKPWRLNGGLRLKKRHTPISNTGMPDLSSLCISSFPHCPGASKAVPETRGVFARVCFDMFNASPCCCSACLHETICKHGPSRMCLSSTACISHRSIANKHSFRATSNQEQKCRASRRCRNARHTYAHNDRTSWKIHLPLILPCPAQPALAPCICCCLQFRSTPSHRDQKRKWTP